MKKFWKMIASAAIAASMVSMTALSVSAVDYGNKPSYTEPEKVEDKTETTPEEPVKVVTEDTVKEALKADEPVVYIEPEKASVKEDAIGEIAKSDKPVTFEAEEYAITIDPALITEVKAINLAMDIAVGGENSSIASDNGIEVPDNAITIIPAQKGEFGMTLSVTIPAAKVADLDVESVKVYYVSDDGEITLIEDAVTVNADGSISVAISHASAYVITDEEIEIPAGEEIDEIEVDDDADEDADDADVDADADEEPADSNPGTGVALAGTAVLALISAAAVATTAKKRK